MAGARGSRQRSYTVVNGNFSDTVFDTGYFVAWIFRTPKCRLSHLAMTEGRLTDCGIAAASDVVSAALTPPASLNREPVPNSFRDKSSVARGWGASEQSRLRGGPRDSAYAARRASRFRDALPAKLTTDEFG
jgi:hypothetical protein